jgi:hypothetical protein
MSRDFTNTGQGGLEPDYEEDHLIPLAVGGSPTSPKNLWAEPYKGKWGARVRDKLERFLYDRVWDGSIRLSKARKDAPQLEGFLPAVPALMHISGVGPRVGLFVRS